MILGVSQPQEHTHMYSPASFKIDEPTVIEDIMSNNPFAIMVTRDGTITHIPINRFGDGKLYGHIARANKHSELESGTKTTAIFSGPHSYISPAYYASEFNVPTWNYATVHCHAEIHFINDATVAWELFKEMVSIYEGEDGWALPEEDRFKSLLNGIRFFELRNPKYEAKSKFNQNKTGKDVVSVISHLKKVNPTAAKFMVSANKSLHSDALTRAGEL